MTEQLEQRSYIVVDDAAIYLNEVAARKAALVPTAPLAPDHRTFSLAAKRKALALIQPD